MAGSGAQQEAGNPRALKRKKTVTWAEDDELELPLGPSPEAAAAAADGGGEPVVLLPADGLYDSIAADLLQQQVGVLPGAESDKDAAASEGGEAGEPLSRRQLLERRLARAEALSGLYESEMWALLEELRLRHAQFTADGSGRSVWKEGSAEAEAAAAAAASSKDGSPDGDADDAAPKQRGRASKQQQKQASKAKDKAAAKAAEAEAAAKEKEAAEAAAAGGPGTALCALWEAQQRQQREASRRAQEETAAGEGEAGGKPGKKTAAAAKQQKGAAAEPAAAAAAAATQPAPAAQPATPPLPPQPRFEAVEALLLSGGAAGLPPVDEASLLEARRAFVQRLELLGRLEQGALAASCRDLDKLGGLAALVGRRCRYVLRRASVAIGRSSGSQGKVDIDLSAGEGAAAAQRVSRHQAQLWLEADGSFRLRCTGRRPMTVNGRPLAQGQTAALPTLSHVAVGGVSLLFLANVAAAERAASRATQPSAA